MTQQANTSSLAPAPVGTIEPDLRIDIRPYGYEYVECRGTRAQLEGEGMIPEGTVWPVGAKSLHLNAGRFSLWLRRVRPDGFKGSKKDWSEADCWALRWGLIGWQLFGAEAAIRRKKEELALAVYRESPQGRAEWSALCGRYWKAHRDERFQAFKTLIPGLVPVKRGRKAKQENAAASTK